LIPPPNYANLKILKMFSLIVFITIIQPNLLQRHRRNGRN
jgi:hypothetical protein